MTQHSCLSATQHNCKNADVMRQSLELCRIRRCAPTCHPPWGTKANNPIWVFVLAADAMCAAASPSAVFSLAEPRPFIRGICEPVDPCCLRRG